MHPGSCPNIPACNAPPVDPVMRSSRPLSLLHGAFNRITATVISSCKTASSLKAKPILFLEIKGVTYGPG